MTPPWGLGRDASARGAQFMPHGCRVRPEAGPPRLGHRRSGDPGHLQADVDELDALQLAHGVS